MFSAWYRACASASFSAASRSSNTSGMAKASTTSVVSPTVSTRIRRRMSYLRSGQLDADTADAVQVPRLGRALAELAPQPGQVDVDRPVATAPRQLPHLGENFALRHHLPGLAGQCQQQVELLAGQFDGATVDGDLAAARVDPQPADHEGGLGPVRRTGTPQHRADPGVQMRCGERLDHVVVGARVEQPDDA